MSRPSNHVEFFRVWSAEMGRLPGMMTALYCKSTSGSQQFLYDLVAAVEAQTGIPAPNVTANRNNWYVKWSRVRAKCLSAWLYVDNAGLMLDRKVVIARQFLAWQPKKQPERGTITDAMRLRFSDYLPS